MPVYFPGIFEAKNEEDAKSIILTNEGAGADTATRWALEAPYVLEMLRAAIPLGPDALVVDYGCGIGRISRALIEACGCAVIGVDISPAMCRMAGEYVASERFLAVSPAQFDVLTAAGLRADAALAVWVLQHCLAPADDIGRMARGLRSDGHVFVLNMTKRAIPAVRDDVPASEGFYWHHDDIDVATLLRTTFQVETEGIPDRSRTPNMGDAGAYWMGLRPSP
jgi:SAM-dependent methyltransferase